MDEHDTYCAEVGHPCVGIYLFRCQKTGEVTMYFHGGSADEPESADAVRFGPFDDWGDIRQQVLVTITDWWERAKPS